MSVDFDGRELRELARDLGEVAPKVAKEVNGIIRKGALKIKNDLRDEAKGVSYAPTFPYTINYDIRVTADGIEAEIGPDKTVVVGNGKYRTPGNLATILYFGAAASGPRLPDPKGALEREAEKVEKLLGDTLGDIL